MLTVHAGVGYCCRCRKKFPYIVTHFQRIHYREWHRYIEEEPKERLYHAYLAMGREPGRMSPAKEVL